MNSHDTSRLSLLLRQTLPPVASDEGPRRDLWPALIGRLNARPAPLPWFDWALLAGLALFAALFPAYIPVFLYYL